MGPSALLGSQAFLFISLHNHKYANFFSLPLIHRDSTYAIHGQLHTTRIQCHPRYRAPDFCSFSGFDTSSEGLQTSRLGLTRGLFVQDPPSLLKLEHFLKYIICCRNCGSILHSTNTSHHGRLRCFSVVFGGCTKGELLTELGLIFPRYSIRGSIRLWPDPLSM